MTTTLLARKGEAVPTGLSGSHRQAIAYAARRVILLGEQAASDAVAAYESSWTPPTPSASLLATAERPVRARPAAGILSGRVETRDTRRRFTFRLDAKQHDALCRAATFTGCSRQKLLERALQSYVQEYGFAASEPRDYAPAVPRLV